MAFLFRRVAVSTQIIFVSTLYGTRVFGFTNAHAVSTSTDDNSTRVFGFTNVHAVSTGTDYNSMQTRVRNVRLRFISADAGLRTNPDKLAAHTPGELVAEEKQLVAEETALLLIAGPMMVLACLCMSWDQFQRYASSINAWSLGSTHASGSSQDFCSVDQGPPVAEGKEDASESARSAAISGGIRYSIAFVFGFVPACSLVLLLCGGALLSMTENWDGDLSRDFIATGITGLRYTNQYPITFAGRLVAMQTASVQLIIFGTAVFLFEDHASSAADAIFGASFPLRSNDFRGFILPFIGLQGRLFMMFGVSAFVFGGFFFVVRGWPIGDGVEVAFAAELGAGVTLDPRLPQSRFEKILLVIITSWGMSLIALICAVTFNQLLRPLLNATRGDIDARTSNGRAFAVLVFFQLPCVMLLLTWLVAVPLALVENLELIDAFEGASSACSCGVVGLLNATPKTIPGHVLVLLASTIGISVLTVATGAVSHAAEPLLKSTGLQPLQSSAQGVLRMSIYAFLMQPALVALLALPLGFLLYLSELSEGNILHCIWFAITVLMGGGTVYTSYMPQYFVAKLLVTIFSSLHVSVVAVSVNLLKTVTDRVALPASK
eukprot:gnl/MRDRNA2_/MRDRNA2_94310_c0_seq1.p1 gnl/MRDRNA2_/MRDRNA2_94310_c0~~gnl/MRDRNA2_/MRDRNA2_94310_c0_seq1.p1  ORF type:complete len:605 (+),score=82.08 gnl/MRDRNA2_/MRDRNA2_94310_c0_seq1:103-1917(+)